MPLTLLTNNRLSSPTMHGDEQHWVDDATHRIDYTYRSCINYMKGLPKPTWEGDYGNQTFDDKSFFAEGIFGFRFVDDYICTNHLDSAYMNSVLEEFCAITYNRKRESCE